MYCTYPFSNAIAKHKLDFQENSKHPFFIIGIGSEIEIMVIKQNEHLMNIYIFCGKTNISILPSFGVVFL